MRYRLRTLLIVLAIGPPVLACVAYVWAIALGAGAPGSIFGSPLPHYDGGPVEVDHPSLEMIEELRNSRGDSEKDATAERVREST